MSPPATRTSLQILLTCPTPANALDTAIKPSRFATFDKVHNPLRLPHKTISERPKLLRTPQFSNTFDFKASLAPQQRALFQHLNFQKCSDVGVFCTFWLWNVLRATTACNCSSLIWPNGSAPAALASLLFDPPEPQIIGKTQWIATFLPFHAPASSVFCLFLFCDLLSSSLLWLFPPLLFHLSILLEVWLLNFLRLYTSVGKLMENGLPSWSSICSSSTRLDVQLGAVTQATSEVAHGSHVLETFTLEKKMVYPKVMAVFHK